MRSNFGASCGRKDTKVSSRADGSVGVIDASKQNLHSVTLAEEARFPDARIRGHSDGQITLPGSKFAGFQNTTVTGLGAIILN